MDKDKLRELLETIKENLPESVEGEFRGGNQTVSECCCPAVVIYLIETDKLVINNAECPNGLLPG